MASSSSPAERARVALALGRCQAPEASGALRRLLIDEVPAVRDAAAFGMGLLGEAASLDDERALLGRLAAEGQVDSRVALADALGRIGADPALPALAALLQDPEERVRVQAAVALGSFGLRSKPIGVERVGALVDRLAQSERPTVRAAAAYALARAAGRLEGDAAATAAAALAGALADAEPDVRMFAARAFSALPPGPVDALAARQDDPDWRVRVNVVRALAKRGGAAAVRAALALAFARAQREGVAGTAVHPLAAGLEVAADLVDNPALRALVQQIHEAALALDGPTTARDLLHCQAAFALDRAGNWPRFVSTCGTPTASPAQRLALEARLLGAAHGDEAARAGRLARLFGSEHALVRASAVEAAAGIAVDAARALVRRALDDPDPAVVAAAAEGVAAHPAVFSRTAPSPLPTPETDAGTAIDRDAGPPPAPVPEAAVVDKLEALVDRLREGEEAETLLSVIGALAALKAGAASRLVPLLRHPVLAVRRKAEQAHRAITGEPAPRPGPPLPPRRPVDAAAVARLAAGPALHAVLHTTRGDVRIRLLVAEAPGTVLNFVTLARQGFYAQKTFHRVVPNFVIQGGDPRGDGYGGPGYSIRCELGPTPYRRGSVGMALAGPDTGGSQFFLMHSRHPHLDGRYTLFAEVVSGQQVVDVVVPGDAVTSVAIE